MSADLLDRALDELVDRCEDAQGNWPDVLRRSSIELAISRTGERPRRRPRLLLVAALVAVAGILVAAAFASGLADRLGAWAAGKPGRPAPAGLQHGFEQRNRAAYASFPAGTKLRLLLTRRSGGVTFSLLGFRNGDAYCLRLVRSDLPNGIGRNECLRAEELAGVPALVTGDVWFSVGRPAKNVNGVFGFADDRVRALRVLRLRGEDRVPVANNVFLSLRAAPAGSVQQHPRPNPIVAVKALLRDGRTRNVPYASSQFGGGIIPGGTRPTGPSYFAYSGRQAIPGPNRVTAPIAHPTIVWLKKHEARGKPLPPVRFSRPRFGRVIQPDPDDPIAVGIAIGDKGALGDYHFEPLVPRAASFGCGPWFPSGPIRLGSWLVGPIEHVTGFVADGITHVTAFLASGRTVHAALRDNVFSVAVSTTELPARIVAYDTNNRVAGSVELPGNAVLTPCPRAVLVKPVSALPAPKPWEKIDLGALTVNGRHILGMTPSEVEAALGTPTVIRGQAQRMNGVAIPEFRYGGSLQSTAGLTIAFSKRGDRIFADRLYYQSPSLVDAKIGHVLRMQASELQREIQRSYGSRYRTFIGYGSNPAMGCTAVLPQRNAPSGITFGVEPSGRLAHTSSFAPTPSASRPRESTGTAHREHLGSNSTDTWEASYRGGGNRSWSSARCASARIARVGGEPK